MRQPHKEKAMKAYDELFALMHDGAMWRYSLKRAPRAAAPCAHDGT